MSSHHDDTPFDDTLLSGYLDGELTQADAQRVRLRLEDDPAARETIAQMRRIRQAARTTELPAPGDEEWNEAPRSRGSRWLRGSGWGLIIVWALVVAGLVVWGLVTGPEAWWQKVLAAALIAGPVLLFASVLLDRIRIMRHDRYGRVKK